jgi:hypothetical protein
MSKYMQIDIRLLPIFGSGGLKGAFPNLFKLLDEFGYTLVLQKEPSLYEMVDVVVRIRNDPHVPDSEKRAIVDLLAELERLRDEVRDLLLSRRLDELDRLLYRLEDMFEALDSKL